MDLLDFLPLLQENADSIRARLDADANAGLAPTDTAFIDTTEGGFYFDATQPSVLEIERLWDFFATQVVAVMFVQLAWGPYLDLHGGMLGIDRKAAVQATGTVTIAGATGTFVPPGMLLAQPATSVADDPVTFEVTGLGDVLLPVVGVWRGDWTPSASYDIADVVLFNLNYYAATGATAIGATDPTVDTAHWAVIAATASEDFPIQAVVDGVEGNVGAGQITAQIIDVDGVTAITNEAATSGGADPESDENYRARLLVAWQSPGAAGNVADYEGWALAWPGVGAVTVNPDWAGAGTVQVVITDPDHNPCSSTVIDGLQQWLDPLDGSPGHAPIGATVTVATVTSVAVSVAANVTLDSGYSIDGADGAVPVQAALDQIIGDYVNGLDPGQEVVLAKVESLFFATVGVHDVSAVTLNGSATNVAVTATQVAVYSPPATLT